MQQKEYLCTGGSGLLGSELKKLLPDANFPPHVIFDVTDYLLMCNYMNQHIDIKTIVHCAAIISPPIVEENPLDALEVNIIGTANVVKLCMKYGLRLIYISSDYVFDGEKEGGLYKESDLVNPVNKYALSKLSGECSVKLHNNYLIIRLSFGREPFPYIKAFIDQHTSRIPVSEAAKKIIKLLDKDITGVIHIGSERRTVMDYALSLGVTPEAFSINDMETKVPKDTSLDTSLYKEIMEEKD